MTNKTVTYVRCKCTSDYQDKRYGPGIRVANRTKKGDNLHADARCTVCGAIHRVPVERFH